MRRTGFTELLGHQLGGSTLRISGVCAETNHALTQMTQISSFNFQMFFLIRFIRVIRGYDLPYNSVKCLRREAISGVSASES